MVTPLLKGDKFHHEFVVSNVVYSMFMEAFQDVNPLHTTDAFAQEKGFPQKLMHGNIMSGFVSYFVGMKLPSKDVMLIGQTVQYVNPVYLGDQLRFEAIVAHWSDSVDVAEFKYVFRKEDGTVASKGKILVKILN